MATRSPFSDLIWTGLDVMASTISSAGALLIQIGDAVSQTTDSDTVEWWQHTGFRSRPQNPTPGKSSCQAHGIRRGDHDMAICSKDERHNQIWSDLGQDEAMIYSFTGNCRVVARNSGEIQLLTSGEVDVGTASPGDAAALASKTDNINNLTKALANALSAVAVNGSTGDVSGGSWAAVITAAQNLAAGISTVKSTRLKVDA